MIEREGIERFADMLAVEAVYAGIFGEEPGEVQLSVTLVEPLISPADLAALAALTTQLVSLPT